MKLNGLNENMSTVTLKDIAKLAGVGPSTVSRVINGHPEVNSKTRENILRIIDEVKFSPNSNARNLKITDSNNIAVLVKGISNTFFAPIIEKVEKMIVNEGYSVVLQQVNQLENEILFATRIINEKKVNGVVFLGGSFLWNSEDIGRLTVPFVFITTTLTYCDKGIFSSVCIDDVSEVKRVTDYLIGLGHKRIAVLVWEAQDNSVAELRLEGYKKSLKANSIDYDEKLLIYAKSYSMEAGFNAVNDALNSGRNDFTAVFAISDNLAVGAARALKDSGYSIPDDISVFGFDGQDISLYYDPVISTMKQPSDEMAVCGVQQLFSLMNGNTNKQVFLEGVMMLGESCCSPKTL